MRTSDTLAAVAAPHDSSPKSDAFALVEAGQTYFFALIVAQRIVAVIVNRKMLVSDIDMQNAARIIAHAKERGWRNLRLLSSAKSTFNRDYHAENQDGAQLPVLTVFVRRGGHVHHAYSTELAFAPTDEGQDPRHVDSIWPLWGIFDFTPDGRDDFHAALRYGA